MTTIRRNYPTNWLPDVFEDLFNGSFIHRPTATRPAINVVEDDKQYRAEVAAPGMSKDDVHIHLNEDGNLVINLEKKEEHKEDQEPARYLRREFSYTKFQQTLLLPEDIEKEQISARVADGILTVTLPKVKPTEKTPLKRNIEVL